MVVSELPKNIGKNLLVGALVIGGGLILLGYANKKLNLTGRFVAGAKTVGSSIGQGLGAGTAEIGVGIAEGFSGVATRGASELSNAVKQFQGFISGQSSNQLSGQQSGQPGPPNIPSTPPAPPPIPPYIPNAAGQIFNIISKTGATLTGSQVTPGTRISSLARGLQIRPPTITQQSLYNAGNLFTGTLTTKVGGTRTITGSEALFQRLTRNLTNR